MAILRKDKKTYLIGYSGHGLVVAEAAIRAGIQLHGYADRVPAQNNPFQLEYIGYERANDFKGWGEEVQFLLGIGDNLIRTRVSDFIRSQGYHCHTVIHPESSVSKYTEIDSGSFIARKAAINPFCQIGQDVIINTSTSVDHECFIENGTHIAPGAVLAGNVKIGKNSFIGANAVIKEGIKIGQNVIVGAGAVVIDDIDDNLKVVGNPAKIIEYAK